MVFTSQNGEKMGKKVKPNIVDVILAIYMLFTNVYFVNYTNWSFLVRLILLLISVLIWYISFYSNHKEELTKCDYWDECDLFTRKDNCCMDDSIAYNYCGRYKSLSSKKR